MATGGSDLLHMKRLTWDAIESQTPPTAARLAQELAIPVKSVCEWLDGESKPDDTHVLAMIKLTREGEPRRAPDATTDRVTGRPAKASAAPDDTQAPPN